MRRCADRTEIGLNVNNNNNECVNTVRKPLFRHSPCLWSISMVKLRFDVDVKRKRQSLPYATTNPEVINNVCTAKLSSTSHLNGFAWIRLRSNPAWCGAYLLSKLWKYLHNSAQLRLRTYVLFLWNKNTRGIAPTSVLRSNSAGQTTKIQRRFATAFVTNYLHSQKINIHAWFAFCLHHVSEIFEFLNAESLIVFIQMF